MNLCLITNLQKANRLSWKQLYNNKLRRGPAAANTAGIFTDCGQYINSP